MGLPAQRTTWLRRRSTFPGRKADFAFPEDAMRQVKRFLLLVIVALCIVACEGQTAQQQNRVRTVHITILSTNLTEEGVGEWGFAALVEADGHQILFDTGAQPDTVLNNAREMKIDLSNISEVVLSHSDDDHTGGLLTSAPRVGQNKCRGVISCPCRQRLFLSKEYLRRTRRKTIG